MPDLQITPEHVVAAAFRADNSNRGELESLRDRLDQAEKLFAAILDTMTAEDQLQVYRALNHGQDEHYDWPKAARGYVFVAHAEEVSGG